MKENVSLKIIVLTVWIHTEIYCKTEKVCEMDERLLKMCVNLVLCYRIRRHKDIDNC